MTSHYHDTEKLSFLSKMAMLSIASLLSYFLEATKSLMKGEKSQHVESFSYDEGVLRGEVHASVKKVYKITVSYSFESVHLRNNGQWVIPENIHTIPRTA